MDNTEDRSGNEKGTADFGVRGLNSEVLARLKLAIDEAGGREQVAKRAGVSLSTLNKALNGVSEPGAGKIAAVVRATGRSLDWVFFGQVPNMDYGIAESASPYEAPGEVGVFEVGDEVGSDELEDELHGRIIDTIMRVAKQVGATIPPIDLGRRAASIHRELVAATADHQERLAMLKLLAVQLRKELIAPSSAQSQAQSGGSG